MGKAPDILISEVMTENPLTVEMSSSAASALEIMEKHKVRHLPVIEHGLPKSLVAKSEINVVLSNITDNEELTVRDLCAIQAYMVQKDTPVTEVLRVMLQGHIGSAIVLDGDRLAGIFTVTDCCQMLYAMLSEKL